MSEVNSRLIDKYEIISTLGRGSMGVVYKARDPEIGRVVAVKTLRSVIVGDDPAGNEALQRFRTESRSAGRLQHPNIVTIFEAGRTGSGSPYIVMEYIEGQSLDQVLLERSPIDPAEILHYLAQVANAIDYAHRNSVIHRDIKPSNIIVDQQFRPHLLDFGVAKLSDTSLTPAGTVVGTPSYMSPEQIRGETLDGSTDLFSFAVVSFEVFTGVRPFPGKDFTTVVNNILHGDPLSFESLGVRCPHALEGVLRRAMAKDRKQRFANALSFVDELAEAYSVMVDGSGLVGGFRRGVTIETAQALLRASRGSSSMTEATPGGMDGRAREATPQSSSLSQVPSTDGMRSVENAPKQAIASFPEREKSRTESTAVDVPPLIPKKRTSEGNWTRMLIVGVIILPIAFIGIWLIAGGAFQSETKLSSTTPESENSSKPPAIPKTEAPPPPKPSLQGITVANISAQSDETIGELLTRSGELGEGGNELLRASIAEAGKRDSASVTTALNSLTNSPDYRVRVDVLKALLGKSHQTRTGTDRIFIGRLNDEEFLVRGFAAKALVEFPSNEVLMALNSRLGIEPNSVVRTMISKSITGVESALKNKR